MQAWTTESRQRFDHDGYFVVNNLLSPAESDNLRDLVVQLAAWEKEQGTAHFYDQDPSYAAQEHASEGRLQRVWNLLNKHADFRNVIQNPVILDAMEDLFYRPTKHPKYVLSSYQANIVGAGAPAQRLHVDTPLPEPLPLYPVKVNTIWALDDLTLDNGATRVVPGSHSYTTKPKAEDQNRDDRISVTCSKGSVIITHGGLWHQSGDNTTDNARIVLLGSFAGSYARDIASEEHYPSVMSPDVIAQCSDKLKQLIGVGHGIQQGSHQAPPWPIDAE